MSIGQVRGDRYEYYGDQLEVKHAAVSAASSGNNTIVAAVTGKKIRVLALEYVCDNAVTVKFQTGAGGTDLTGARSHAQYSGLVLPFNQFGWFETAAGALLNAVLGGAVGIRGSITYVELP